MKHSILRTVTGLIFSSVLGVLPAAAARNVIETSRDIPVAYDVDVVVVGGSAPGVEAAVVAANAGAKVFLAAPRPYLGEDICAPKRLWLEAGEEPGTELARELFSDKGKAGAGGHPRALPFTYQTDVPFSKKHADTTPPRLTDGSFLNPVTESVQYDGDVTVICDLGETRDLEQVRVMVFQRVGDFELGTMTVETSADGTLWTQTAPVVKSAPVATGHQNDGLVTASAHTEGSARYVRVRLVRAPEASRILVGEIEIISPVKVQAKQTAGTPTGPIRPMHIKKTLDDALLEAGVNFLYGCYATDVLVDADGALAGIVMANRAGRQAVLAKVIIDATERATVARLAGAKTTPYPAGETEFQRIVIGGDVKTGDGISGRRTGLFFGRDEIIEYHLRLSMPDSTFASFSEANNRAIDLTFDPKQVDASEFLFQVPPDVVMSEKALTGPWPGAETVSLNSFRPKGISRLFVLGGCADIPRTVAADLLRPTGMMPLGARIGKAAAAAEAQSVEVLREVRVRSDGGENRDVPGEVKEFLAGPRSVADVAVTVPSALRSLPVLGTYEVVVVGGGTGGAPAGIGAGRSGARALVIEYQYALGGVGTLGMITKYYYGHRDGFTKEADEGVRGLKSRVWWIGKAEWWRRANREANTDVWTGVLGCGAFVQDNVVKGVVVATPSGRGVVLAGTVIDSTGNCDIAAAAGAKTSYTDGDHVAVQGSGLPPIDLGKDYTNTDYMFADDTDVVDFWHQFVCAREKFSRAYDLGQLVDTRERRRIVGDVTISPMDMILGRTWPDTVSLHKSNFDSHGFSVHPIFMLEPPHRKSMIVYVPLRAMVPAGLGGIIVTGLGVSAHRDAIPVIRMQPCVQNQGYAAGMIAAESATSSCGVREVDLKPIQKRLLEMGCLTSSAFEPKVEFPLPVERVRDAVRNVANGHRELAVVLSHSDIALPMLREAYDAVKSPEDKLMYAHICGMLGDACGASTLAETVAGAKELDKGWNYRGMGQYGMSISQLDSYIIALGRTRRDIALDPILGKAALLDAEKEFSHHRAVSIALETLCSSQSSVSVKDRQQAAKALARVLDKPGMTGYATDIIEAAQKQVDKNRTSTVLRNNSLRELVLARALYRCGDCEGKGEAILRQYAADLRGHYARHARAILGGSR